MQGVEGHMVGGGESLGLWKVGLLVVIARVPSHPELRVPAGIPTYVEARGIVVSPVGRVSKQDILRVSGIVLGHARLAIGVPVLPDLTGSPKHQELLPANKES